MKLLGCAEYKGHSFNQVDQVDRSTAVELNAKTVLQCVDYREKESSRQADQCHGLAMDRVIRKRFSSGRLSSLKHDMISMI